MVYGLCLFLFYVSIYDSVFVLILCAHMYAYVCLFVNVTVCAICTLDILCVRGCVFVYLCLLCP